MLNLDTHILLFALANEVTAKERKLLAGDEWGISAIVLWEITKLAQLGRINVGMDDADLRRILRGIHTWSLDVHVCRSLLDLDIRSDPADELIAATSLAHGVPLVTRDRRLLASHVVPLA